VLGRALDMLHPSPRHLASHLASVRSRTLGRGLALLSGAAVLWPAVSAGSGVQEVPTASDPGAYPPAKHPGVHLSWVRDESASTCPDASHIALQAAARLGDDPFALPPQQFVEAVVSRDARQYRVTITMRDAAGALVGTRTLTSMAPDCGVISRASALTIAILIDPDAWGREAPSAPTAPRPPAVPELRAASEPERRPDAGGRIVALAITGTGFSPDITTGPALAGSAYVSPMIAISALVGFFPEHRTTGAVGDFAFGLSYGEIAGCLALPLWGASSWELCGGLLGGALHIVVYSPEPANPGQRWTVAASERTRLVLPLFGRTVLEIGVGASEPFTRRSFYVAGAPPGMDTVFTQPAVAVAGWAGLGVHWN
jgi:hypothetical protein